MKTSAGLLIGSIVALGCGCEPANNDNPCPLSQGLVGGVPDNTPGHKAVLAVVGHFDKCSGTLIAPRRFITAAHCCVPGNGSRLTVTTTPEEGRSEDRPSGYISVMGTAFIHPKYEYDERYDLCLITLDRPIDIVPIAVAEAAPTERNTAVTIVGFGVNQIDACNGAETGYGVRRQGKVVITNFSPNGLAWETRSPAGEPAVWIWHGDSGGALLWEGVDGIERLIGVTRNFDYAGDSGFVNAVTNRDWIVGATIVDAGTVADGDVAHDADAGD